jgi:hypothetical protein
VRACVSNQCGVSIQGLVPGLTLAALVWKEQQYQLQTHTQNGSYTGVPPSRPSCSDPQVQTACAAAAMAEDWGPSWDFTEVSYPALPKSFTAKKAAKKRKHKELFVTEEQLLKPVKLKGMRLAVGSAAHTQHTAV